MEIQVASVRDLGALRRLESACFEKDAWSIFDLVAVLTWPDVIRLKAVEDDEMVGFVAGDPRRESLDAAPREIWSSEVYTVRDG